MVTVEIIIMYRIKYWWCTMRKEILFDTKLWFISLCGYGDGYCLTMKIVTLALELRVFP